MENTSKRSNQRQAMRPAGGPGGMMRGPAEKPKNFRGTMRQLAGYLAKYRVRLVLVLLFAIIGTIFTIVGPKILAQATDQIVNDYVDQMAYTQIHKKLPAGMTLPAGTTGGELLAKLPASQTSQIPDSVRSAIQDLDITTPPVFHYDAIRNIILWLIGLYLLSAFFSYLQAWIMTAITQDVTKRFRRDISQKINRLPLSYFDKRTNGEVLSRITNDVDTVGQTLNQSLSQIVTSVVTLIGVLVMMLTISWELTLVTIIILPLGFLALSWIMKRSQKQLRA